MLASMPLPCNCDPCLHLPIIHHYATPMCICMLGGDPCCYCHVYHVPHAIDAILLISCLHACDMSCALFMTTICTHDILDMITSSMLHLRTTSLLALIHMIACFVASPMFHYYLLSWVDDVYVHASRMIHLVHCRLPPIVASMLIDLGDLDTLFVMHACLIEPIVFGCSRIICLHTMKCSPVLSYDEHDAYTCWVFYHTNDRFCISANLICFFECLSCSFMLKDLQGDTS